MMQKLILGLAAIAFIALAGCTEQNNGQMCAQVITYATSPEGICEQFATPCDVPNDYNVVQSCGANNAQADLCAGITCEDACIGTTFYSGGTCSLGKCVYTNQANNSQSCLVQSQNKYDFDANLLFCEFDGLLKKYTLFYQIRNQTDNMPEYKSTIWLKIPSIDYSYVKTIQRNYRKGSILWEDQRYSHVGQAYNGQFWDIRNIDSNASLDFQLIYCESDYSTKELCTPQNGVVITEGNTAQLCRIAGETQ